MQQMARKRQATSTRRSSRLAKNSRDAPAASTPVLLPLGGTSTSLPPPPAPTLADKSAIAVNQRIVTQASVGDLKAPNHFIDTHAHDADKENMEPSFLPQLADRIKQNRRQATKRSYTPVAPPRRTSKQPSSAPSQASAGKAASDGLSLQMPAPSAVIDLTTSPSLPPTALPFDPVLSESGVQQPDPVVLRSSSPAIPTGEASNTLPSPALKRDAEPGCDPEPPTKRSRSATSPVEEDVDDVDPGLPSPLSEFAQLPQVTATATEAASQALGMDQTDRATSPNACSLSEMPEIAPLSSEPEHSSRAEEDIGFIEKVQKSLAIQSKRKEANVGKRQARRILQLLKLAKSPDRTEALFLSGKEAKAQLEANQCFPGPIFTEGQQPLDLQTIDGFLDEHYDDDAKVSIQDPRTSVKVGEAVREITIGKLKEHFAKDRVLVPYNCLELAAHVEDGLRPAFLNNEDCRLLTKLKHPSSEDHASRRNYAPGWKEVEKWALLARAGALTEPHQDSHGYSTYITVNQGVIGFGWLANPTPDQRAAWRANHSTFTDGNWRYAVLRPGQTVFFPSGTVHFVFRHTGSGDTLAFGGHVLRCSQIVRWARTLLEEQASYQITNEAMSVSAPEYLRRVEKFVRQARAKGQEGKWGGVEAVEEFLRLKAVFDEREAARE